MLVEANQFAVGGVVAVAGPVGCLVLGVEGRNWVVIDGRLLMVPWKPLLGWDAGARVRCLLLKSQITLAEGRRRRHHIGAISLSLIDNLHLILPKPL